MPCFQACPLPYHERYWSLDQELLHPKKTGALPKEGDEEAKRTNEIKMAIPLLDTINIEGKVITADALLTQRAFADYQGEHVKLTITLP
jgi:hypothetical protein